MLDIFEEKKYGFYIHKNEQDLLLFRLFKARVVTDIPDTGIPRKISIQKVSKKAKIVA